MSTVSAASEEPRPAATVGEVYAYRARAVDELVPVRVLKEGTKRPARVLIRFDDPAMEGREEWVPPSRLKARWEDIDDFRAGEARWDAVCALRPGGDSPEANAALMATELVISRDVAEFGDRGGYLEVHDSAALLRLTGVDAEFLDSHPASFVDGADGPLVVPWPIAIVVIQKALQRNAEPVLSQVAQDEAKARYEAIYGRQSSVQPDTDVPAESCAEWDQKSSWGAPMRAVLRSWAGDAAERWDELVELRKEIKRVGDVAEDAIRTLRDRGHRRDADRLETELGMTVDMLRHDRK